jgi:ABC-type uncharacterized transport system permease subunit
MNLTLTVSTGMVISVINFMMKEIVMKKTVLIVLPWMIVVALLTGIAVHTFDRREVVAQTVKSVCAVSYAPWETPPAGCGRNDIPATH